MSWPDPKRIRSDHPSQRTLEEEFEDEDDYLPRRVIEQPRQPAPVGTPRPKIKKTKPVLSPTDLFIKKKVNDPKFKATLQEVKPLLEQYNCADRALIALKSLKSQAKKTVFLEAFYDFLKKPIYNN